MIKILKIIIAMFNKLLSKSNHEIELIFKNKINILDADEEFNKLVQLTKGKTIISKDRLYILYQGLISTSKLEGDLAELGVFKGGSAKLLSHLAMKLCPQKTLYLFDTFKGLPKSDSRYDIVKEGLFNDTNINSVKKFLADSNNIEIIEGLFSNTLQHVKDKRFCFIHVDVDLYSSVKECIEFLYPRLTNGGIIIFDDYSFLSCPGVKKAVDNFFKNKKETPIYIPTGQSIVYRINNYF